MEAEGLLDYQGRAGIISIVRWNLRPVIFGVDLLGRRQRHGLPKAPLLGPRKLPCPLLCHEEAEVHTSASKEFSAVQLLVNMTSAMQRWRDDNKTRICAFEGGGLRGQRGKSSKNAAFRGKRHDNKNLKSEIFIVEKFCCRCAGSYPHCRMANVAVQLLQCNFPKIAAQLPLSLVACCRGWVWRVGV